MDLFQKADDGLGLGDEAIDCFEVAQHIIGDVPDEACELIELVVLQESSGSRP